MKNPSALIPEFELNKDSGLVVLPDGNTFSVTSTEMGFLETYPLRTKTFISPSQLLDIITPDGPWQDEDAIKVIDILVKRLNRKAGCEYFTSGYHNEDYLDSKTMIGNLVIDYDQKVVSCEGVSIHLTPTEFSIIQSLAKVSPNPISIKEKWQSSNKGRTLPSSEIKVYVRRIRSKLDRTSSTATIITHSRFGYKLAVMGKTGESSGL